MGIANLLVTIMMEEGIPQKQCEDKVFLFDVDGLLTNKRPSGIPKHAMRYGKDLEPTKDFAGAVESLKPTCLIGKFCRFLNKILYCVICSVYLCIKSIALSFY